MFTAARRLVVGLNCEARLLASQVRTTANTSLTSTVKLKSQDSSRHEMPMKATRDHLSVQLLPDFQPVNYCVDDFKQLMKDNYDGERIHLILLEHQTLLDSTGRAPPRIREEDMGKLMLLDNYRRRAKYFNFMFQSQMAEIKQRIKKRIRQVESRPNAAPLVSNSIMLSSREKQLHKFYNWRMASAATLGQKLVLDCSFEQVMGQQELGSLGTQLQLMYNVNKVSRDPFDLILSDIPKGGQMDSDIDKYLPHINSGRCLVTKSYDSFLEMFPDRRVIYLSPNSNNLLTKWDSDAVFVIGALVDRSCTKQLSIAKAKQHHLEHVKLPVGLYLTQFKPNTSQALNIDTVANILLTMKQTNDWNQAFEKIPRRLTYNIDKVQARSKVDVFVKKRRSQRREYTSGL